MPVTDRVPNNAGSGEVGGHALDETVFSAKFGTMPDIQCTKAPMPQSAKMLKPGVRLRHEKRRAGIANRNAEGAGGPSDRPLRGHLGTVFAKRCTIPPTAASKIIRRGFACR